MATKRKETPRERRERELAERKKKFAPQPGTLKPTQENTAPAVVKTDGGDKQKTERRIKSSAKAAGLKSVFTLGNGEQLMTSFGRGNEAVLEKRVQGGRIESVRGDGREAFAVREENNRYVVRGRVAGSSDIPAASDTGDLIGVKAALERRYFGETFDDNVHVQLTHSIQDVSKILAPYANNIIFTLDNLDRDADMERDDFVGIGHLTLDDDYAAFCAPDGRGERERRKPVTSKKAFDRFIGNPRLSYYGNAFCRMATREERLEAGLEIFGKKSPEEQAALRDRWSHNRKSESREIAGLAPEMHIKDGADLYYVLALLGELREACVHGGGESCAVFRLEEDARPGAAGARELLDRIYRAKINELGGFDRNSTRSNFSLLFTAEDADTAGKKRELAQQYYRFAILKESKSSGYSVRLLREKILRDLAPEYCGHKYNVLRAKLYPLMDFLIWRYYEARPDAADELCASLRAAVTEEAKERIYRRAAKECYETLREKYSRLAEEALRITGKENRALELSGEDKLLVRRAIDRVRIQPEASCFTKLIYLVTLFLDSKEINDLLTTLICAFENVESFLSVLRENGMKTDFAAGYALFEDSGRIAKELRAVNSFARMRREPIGGKLAMFEDAACILGMPGGLAERTGELRQYLSDNILDRTRLRRLPNGKPDTGFRNFIITNVIESRRFRYLARYGNPRRLRAFLECRPLVGLVLGEMPESILRRYYELCVGAAPASAQKRIDALTDKLLALRFTDFEDVNQRANAERDPDKQRRQALVSLYLNVGYQIVKNLVYVNARYTTANHCLERDWELKKGERFRAEDGEELSRCLELTEDMLKTRREELALLGAQYEKGPNGLGRDAWLELVRTLRRKRRVADYLDVNLAALRRGGETVPDEKALLAPYLYRRNVARLSVIRGGDRFIGGLERADSWFAVYHYLMQRTLEEQLTRSPDAPDGETRGGICLDDLPAGLHRQLTLAGKHGTCCKDLIKVLNVPFAYNLPRFKNLSIDGLFDRNRPGKDESRRTERDAAE